MKKLLLIIALFLILVLPAKANINSGLVAWWSFDTNDWSGTTVTDLSGNGNNGNAASALTEKPGPVGQAITTTNYIASGSGGGIANSSNSIWVYITAYPSAGTMAFISGATAGDNTGTTDKNLWLTSSGNIVWYIYSGGTQCDTSSNTLALNTWYLVTGTEDGGNMHVYINGLDEGDLVAGEAQTNDPQLIVNGTANVAISVCGISSGGNWVRLAAGSRFDDFRFYNRAISASEAKQLYYNGLYKHFNWPF